jgi:uncharacterized protein YfaS (alpha-2-macroglobulin family)
MKRKNHVRTQKFWIGVLSSLLILATLLSACGFLSGKTPTDEITKEADIESVTATPEPRKDLPPALVEVTPVPDSIIGLQQEIRMIFNQAMNKSSVEAAISFEPKVQGRFVWEDDQTLTFTPDRALPMGHALHLEIQKNAQALNEKSLQEAIQVNYQTADSLKVLQVVPSDRAEDVDPESIIFVTFNQPVVPLGGEAQTDPAFSLSPEVPGEGTWLNTSTYAFTPDPSLNGGVRYTIQLDPALLAGSGAQLDTSEELQYRFTTTVPQVLHISPQASERLRLDGPIVIQFNIRMDPDSVAEHFRLIAPGGEAVPGRFEWDEAYQSGVFTPDNYLERNTTYILQLDQETSSWGGLPIDAAVETTRTTYPSLALDTDALTEFSSYYAGYGQYQVNFTAPLNKENIDDFVVVQPQNQTIDVYVSGEKQLVISGYLQPETTYTVTIDGDLEDVWGGKLQQELISSFFTPPATPSLSVYTGMTAYNMAFIPASASEIVLQATNVNTVYFDLAPISLDDLMTLLHPDNYNYRQVFLPANLETTRHNLVLARNVNEVKQIPLEFQGEPLSPGIYFLGISSPEITDEWSHYQKFLLIVSDNNLVMKNAPQEAFVWGTRLADYAPLSDVPVRIYNTEGNLIASGQTGTDGIFVSDVDISKDYFGTYFSLVGEQGHPDFGFTISSWNHQYDLYELGISVNTHPALLDAYIYTDRPVYRPGDTIYFKAAIFERQNGIPMPVAFDTVRVSIYGDAGVSGMPATLYDEDLELSAYGTVEGEVTLSEKAATGNYNIQISHDDDYIKDLYFDLAAYRKPQIELTVDLTPDESMREDGFTAEIQADTYFGLPVSEISYEWAIFNKQINFELPGYQVGPMRTDWLGPVYWGGTGYAPAASFGESSTDTEGHAWVEITEDDLPTKNITPGSTQEVIFEVTFTEESGFPVSQRDTSVMHPEEFYIGVQPESYFGKEDTPISFSILTADWERNPMGNIPLEVSFDTIEWRYEESPDPGQPYRYVVETTPVSSASPITGADGRSRVTFTPPDPGTYLISLKSGGAVTEAMIWVAGSGTAIWPMQPKNQIKLTADAEDYQPGQIAQVFFPNPFAGGAKALVTVERGEIMEAQIIDIDGASHTLSVPITQESIPNIYLSVMLLGKDGNGAPVYRHGTINLPVAPLSKMLNLDITLDPKLTEPGEKVSAILTVTDQLGNPVQGEFSVAVVDKAVLALMEPNSLPILEAFFRKQPLSVLTSFSLLTYAIQTTDVGYGIGGGGGGDGMAALTIREEFPDTALWLAEIITGADGKAEIEIPLPDSLTTWVVAIRGLTENYLVGEAEAEIQTQKALMIQPVTPRFFVDGDVVELASVVYNNTSEPLSVDVSLVGTGFVLSDPSLQNQNLDIDPGENARVAWTGTVESIESADLVFRAVSGDLQDASASLWGDLPVKRYLMPQTFSTAGLLPEESARMELISLPVTVDPSSGELLLALYPSLTSSLLESLEELEDAPYEDTVSTLSKLMANLNAYLALRDLGVDSPQLQENLEDLVIEGIRRLLESQNPDGGWSWWAGAYENNITSDPFVTAYVLIGLDQASQAGLQVGTGFITQAQQFLAGNLSEPSTISESWMLDRLVFIAYALRNSDIALNTTINGLYNRRTELSPWALGLLSLTLDFIGSSDARVNTLINDLEALAVRSATGVYWESENKSWATPGSLNFNSAVAVYALAQLDPASTSLAPALQYLLMNRKPQTLGSSPFESAWLLMAVTAALKGTGDYQANYDYQALLNDVLILEGSAGGTVPLTAVTTSETLAALYPDAPNALMVERGAGTGTLYYRVDLQTYQPAGSAEPINKGISLQRDYYLAGEGCPGGPDCEPIDSLVLDADDPSQRIIVSLTMIIPHDMVNVMVEDNIPAGTEIINRQFLTTQMFPEEEQPLFNPRNPFDQGWGWWYFRERQIYDDHILWTAEFLPAGTYTLTYELYPYQRGVYQVLPAHAWQYFYPEVQGTSSGSLFAIE